MSKRKVIDYCVCVSVGTDRLTTEVKKMMQDGWHPIGGIAFDVENSWCNQAMIKYEEKKNHTPGEIETHWYGQK
jgi:hypothetical protein